MAADMQDVHDVPDTAAQDMQGIVAVGASMPDGLNTRATPQQTMTSASGIVGVDEAGRGPLAGPVYAAAVLLDPQDPIGDLADSKTLTAGKREQLAAQIRRRARAWCIALADVHEIDALNILNATLLAMRRACLGLPARITLAQIDGNRVPPDLPFRAEAIVKGDATIPAIAAASILAKTARDAHCQQLHTAWPQYAFDQHKGYGTALHLERLRIHGLCPAHRVSFAPVRQQMARLDTAAIGMQTFKGAASDAP